jgi:hypothetical protein
MAPRIRRHDGGSEALRALRVSRVIRLLDAALEVGREPAPVRVVARRPRRR